MADETPDLVKMYLASEDITVARERISAFAAKSGCDVGLAIEMMRIEHLSRNITGYSTSKS
jgi:hypothetical protein